MTGFAEDVCDIIGIISDGDLIIHGSPEEIIQSTQTKDLEEAYLKIVGGKVDRETLLAWR
jgi:ABC-2 type transport system ATP-binding protein